MQINKNYSYSFDSFFLEVSERRLFHNNELVPITPKAFDLLVIFLERKGRVVEKNVLLDEIWQDTFVGEATLMQNVSTLRKILGTYSEGKQYIETVPRHGYRFIATVKEVLNEAEDLVVEHHKHTQLTIEHQEILNGNAATSGISPNNNLEKIENSVSEPSRLAANSHRQKNIRWVAGLITVFLLTAAIIIISLRPEKLSSSSFRQIELSKLTSNGNIYQVAISPDGKNLAFVEKKGDNQSLQLRQVDNSTTIEIVPPKKQYFIGLNFSLDGRQIFFVSYDLEKRSIAEVTGTLYKVSTLGGPVQKIIGEVHSPIALSPDGKRFAFVRNLAGEKKAVLRTASFNNKDEKDLTDLPLSELFTPIALDWSPDGKTIAATIYKNRLQMNLAVINAESGEQRFLTSEPWQWLGQPKWLADGSGIVLLAYSGQSGNQSDEIWQISYPDGAARKITSTVSGVCGLGLISDSRLMVAVKSEKLSSFWIDSFDQQNKSIQITQVITEPNITLPGINWMPDGKIIYGSTLNGNLDIWISDPDGTHKKQLTSDGRSNSMPVVSPNGQQVFFISNRSGQQNIWRMNIDGGEQTMLTNEIESSSPSVSPDGKYIFYTSLDPVSQQSFLRKISVDGDKPVQINSVMTVSPQISPDGKVIACYYPADDSPGSLKVTILSVEDGKVIKQFGLVRQDNLAPIAWRDNQTLTYAVNQGDGSSLLLQSLSANEPQIFLNSPDEKIFRFAWSKNGKQLIYEKGKSINDVILIKSVEQ